MLPKALEVDRLWDTGSFQVLSSTEAIDRPEAMFAAGGKAVAAPRGQDRPRHRVSCFSDLVLACDRLDVRIGSREIKRGDVHGVRGFRGQHHSTYAISNCSPDL